MGKDELEILDTLPGVTIFHATLEPGSVLYVPSGCLLFERAVGTGCAVGTRVATLDRVWNPSFFSFVKTYGLGVPEETLSNFWLSVVSALDESEAKNITAAWNLEESEPAVAAVEGVAATEVAAAAEVASVAAAT